MNSKLAAAPKLDCLVIPSEPSVLLHQGEASPFHRLITAPIPPERIRPGLPEISIPGPASKLPFFEHAAVALLVTALKHDDFDTRLAAQTTLRTYVEKYGADLYPAIRHGFAHPESAHRIELLFKGKEKLLEAAVVDYGRTIAKYVNSRLSSISSREIGSSPLPVKDVFQLIREMDAAESSFSIPERELVLKALAKAKGDDAIVYMFFAAENRGSVYTRDPKGFSYAGLGITWAMMSLQFSEKLDGEPKDCSPERRLELKGEYAFQLFENLVNHLPGRLASPKLDGSAFETARSCFRLNLHTNEAFRQLWSKSGAEIWQLDHFKNKKE